MGDDPYLFESSLPHATCMLQWQVSYQQGKGRERQAPRRFSVTRFLWLYSKSLHRGSRERWRRDRGHPKYRENPRV